jgi:hypothetical protein
VSEQSVELIPNEDERGLHAQLQFITMLQHQLLELPGSLRARAFVKTHGEWHVQGSVDFGCLNACT